MTSIIEQFLCDMWAFCLLGGVLVTDNVLSPFAWTDLPYRSEMNAFMLLFAAVCIWWLCESGAMLSSDPSITQVRRHFNSSRLWDVALSIQTLTVSLHCSWPNFWKSSRWSGKNDKNVFVMQMSGRSFVSQTRVANKFRRPTSRDYPVCVSCRLRPSRVANCRIGLFRVLQ